MKLPTKAQWLEIAEAFDTPYGNRTPKQLRFTTEMDNKKRSRTGICWVFWSQFNRKFMEYADCFAGWSSEYWRVGHDQNFVWPNSDKGDRERAFFCCMMAAITEAGDMESMIEEV